MEIYSETSNIELPAKDFAHHWGINIDTMSSSKFGVRTDAMDGQLINGDGRGTMIGRKERIINQMISSRTIFHIHLLIIIFDVFISK